MSGMYPHLGFVAGRKPENEPQYGFGHCGSFLLRYLATALPSRQVALPLRLLRLEALC